jgi:hypothetical protein
MARVCGSCTLCCKLLTVPDLEPAKPRDVWCEHCLQGTGCGIYERRPQSCRVFDCVWLQRPGLPDTLRPDRCKVVLTTIEAERALVAQVDPGYPDAWRRPEIARLLKLNLGKGIKVMVRVGETVRVLGIADLP